MSRFLALFAFILFLSGCGGARRQEALPAPSTLQSVPQAVAQAVAAASGFSGLRVSFEHSLLCDNGVLIAKYAQQYGIKTIFVPVANDDIISLLAGNPTTVKNLKAMSAVAKVYMLTGSSDWIASPTTVPPDVTSLIKIAGMYPDFSGILFAIDPEQAAGWNSSQRATLLHQYFSLVATIVSAPGESVFQQVFFTADPDYATLTANLSGSGPTILQQLEGMQGVKGIMLLAPGNSASSQLANVNSAIAQLTQPFWIEASTSKYSPKSYFGQTSSYLQSNLAQLQQSVFQQNSKLLGIEVNGWNDLYNSLQSILAQPPTWNGSLPSGALVPPTGKTYLGGFINPTGTGASPAQTANFESQIGRTLAYNMHFYGWNQAFPGSAEQDDIAHGRIPLIAWNCGNSDANVAAGAEDSIIIARAQALKAFGSPVFLRWFWEMNLDDTNNAPRTQCYDPNTDLPQGYFSPMQYIAAWDHIRAIFAQQGVTNVVWLWCVANAHGGPAQYYPGDNQVDWVGMDDYDTYDVSMHNTFYILANELSQFQEKPFMITETGAHPQMQHTFLNGAAAELQAEFPQVRAIGYLDSQGSFQNWVLSSTGLADFTTFAHDPYMSAMAPNP